MEEDRASDLLQPVEIVISEASAFNYDPNVQEEVDMQ
jgi:hypothetical protein